MGKKHKRSSQPSTGKTNQGSNQSSQSSGGVSAQSSQAKSISSQPLQTTPSPAPTSKQVVKPEQMSLDAYQHIQLCLNGKSHLEKEDVTAILRLSQHLRIFGLLSAVGYLNQAKAGKVQDRTKPMWMPLLWRLVYEHEPSGSEHDLMTKVERMARENAPLYMATWRKALILSNHWNFWARAHQREDKLNEQENAVHGSEAN